jgi:16S rRNA (cytosine967-C5)-methyltransferase
MAEAEAARRGALALLNRVFVRHEPLGDTVAEGEPALAALAPPDRARAQRLALETLRRIGPADAVLAPMLRRPPAAPVRMLLRLAVVELALDPGSAHGIVGSAVEIAKTSRGMQGQSGFVNAVLRRVAVQPAALHAAPVQRLPDVLRDRLVSAWGDAATTAIEAAHAAGAPLDLTPRDAADANALAARLGATVLPTGSLRIAAGVRVSALPGYDAGEWWVQDAAAAVPVRLLALRGGERVADLCAAPGGKAMQAAAAGAQVTALDSSPARLDRLRANLARTGLRATCIEADARDWAGPDEGFDAVLVDAPCSATGTIRRHPDLPFVRDLTDLPVLLALQSALIDRAVALVRPGGRVLFCTCSLLPEEGEAQLAAALARHRALAVEPVGLPGLPEGVQAAGGGLRLRPDMWPERGGIDGFFIALLRRG